MRQGEAHQGRAALIQLCVGLGVGEGNGAALIQTCMMGKGQSISDPDVSRLGKGQLSPDPDNEFRGEKSGSI